MDDITNKLAFFSDKFDLWTKAKAQGLSCIKNYLNDGSSKELGDISGLTADKFLFSKNDQALIFFNNADNGYKLRTTYALETILADGKKVFGQYSLDVDKNGKFIDDWLIFI